MKIPSDSTLLVCADDKTMEAVLDRLRPCQKASATSPNDDATHKAIRSKIYDLNPGWLITGYCLSDPQNAELCQPCPPSTPPRQETTAGQGLA